MPGIIQQERPNPAKVIMKAILNARREYEIGYQDLGEVLGMSESQTRRLTPDKGFSSKAPMERGIIFMRALRALETLVGDDLAAAKAWLFSKNREFDDQRPIDLLKQHEGMVDVVRYLDSMRGP